MRVQKITEGTPHIDSFFPFRTQDMFSNFRRAHGQTVRLGEANDRHNLRGTQGGTEMVVEAEGIAFCHFVNFSFLTDTSTVPKLIEKLIDMIR